MGTLDEIRESTRPELEGWLAEAQERRRALEWEMVQLDAEIARARSWLGEHGGDAGPAKGRMTLHGAMELVLREGGNRGMKAADLARAIADRDLYRKGDGDHAGQHQVQARVSNYPDRFVRDSGVIKLRA